MRSHTEYMSVIKKSIKRVLLPKTIAENERLILENSQIVADKLQLMSENADLTLKNSQLDLEVSRLISEKDKLISEHTRLVKVNDGMRRQIYVGSDKVPNTGLPSIFLITLPKSASKFIFDTLLNSLNMTNHSNLGCSSFPDSNIHFDLLPEFCEGGLLASTHCEASPHNLSLLKHFQIKTIVHLRDPRAALLSWTHYLIRLHKEDRPHSLMQSYPPPSEELFQESFDSILAWSFNNYFSVFTNWIDKWIRAVDDKELSDHVKIMTYESFVNDPEVYFKDFLGFYDLDIEKHSIKEVPKNRAVNFRKGDPDEWRNIFNEEMQEKALAMMDKKWFEQFSWVP